MSILVLCALLVMLSRFGLVEFVCNVTSTTDANALVRQWDFPCYVSIELCTTRYHFCCVE